RGPFPGLDIEYVEGLKAKLQLEAFTKRNALERGEINVMYRRSAQGISSKRAECADGSSKGARIEPGCYGVHLIRSAATLRDCLLTIRIGIGGHRTSDIRIGDLIGSKVIVRRTRSAATQVGQIASYYQIEWRA